jgi:short-subunit dehydrogenase
MKKHVILITGASSGIGKATAELLSAQGHHVYGTTRKAADPSQIPASNGSGGFISMLTMDVTSDASVASAIETILSKEGRIDVLICNAGTGIAGSIEDTTVDEAKSQFETNFFGALRVMRSLLPVMRAQGTGKIIAVSSVAGIISIPYQAHYSASKFAIEGLIEALRHEIAPFGIKACVVEPGDTKTGFTQNRVLAQKAREQTAYSERFTRSLARMEHDEQNGVPPLAVAKVIARMIKKRNPPIRVAVGFQYKAILLLKRIMPSRLTEKIVGMLYN